MGKNARGTQLHAGDADLIYLDRCLFHLAFPFAVEAGLHMSKAIQLN